MIDLKEAICIVQSKVRDFGVEEIDLSAGIGRVLREDWYCDRDLPPYNRVTMDGIALNYEGAKGLKILPIKGVVAAGDPESALVDPSTCVEIMTGAMLPIGADTIIRYEDLDIKDGQASINVEYQKNQNIHWRGEDRKEGELLVPSKTLLSSSEIGVGASIGKAKIKVSKLPKTIVISTGNELVEVHETPAPHQIRRGNVYRIQSTLQHIGLKVDTAHIKDDQEETIEQLAKSIEEYDLVILSGGVSKGKFDFLPGALQQCGVQKHFHRVAQRPGKPIWFGTHPNGTTVFALPGNPVSSFMCLTVYLTDWIRGSLGLPMATRMNARLSEDVSFKPDLTYFLEVAVHADKAGSLIAVPKKGNGSGDLANLLYGDAFIRLPRGKSEFKAGEVYPYYEYR